MDWLAIELLTGFQKLLCLGLDRTPATDLIDGTVMAWHEAVTTGRVWDQQRDAPRIRAAFVTLASTRDTWPAPKHFLDALPRVEQAALTYQLKPADPARALAAIAEAQALLRADRPEPQPITVTDDGRSLAEHEADLQRHYSDRKSQAAGGDA